jgi:tetratricopeptide (TPR) repeat protein
MLSLLWTAWRLRSSAPLASAGLAWIPLSLLPFIGLTAVKNTMGDRYLLFATAGVAMTACAAIARMTYVPYRRAALASALLLAGVWGAAARARLPDYAGDEAFYRASLAQDPVTPRAHLGLGLVLVDKNAPEGERELRRAVAAWPGSRGARMYLAAYLMSRRRGDEAIEILQALVRENPNDDAARWRLAQSCAQLSRTQPAIRAYDELLARRPDYWPANREAGRLLMKLKRYREAVFRLRAAATSNDRETLELLQLALRGAGLR